MLPALHDATLAVNPLKVTWPVPCAESKLAPWITTAVPGSPEAGFKLLMVGRSTVKLTPLVCTPPAVTTTGPVVLVTGTTAVMLLFDQFVTVAPTPLKLTVPAVPLNPFPKMVMAAPGSPLKGLRDEIEGPFSRPVKAKVEGEF